MACSPPRTGTCIVFTYPLPWRCNQIWAIGGPQLWPGRVHHRRCSNALRDLSGMGLQLSCFMSCVPPTRRCCLGPAGRGQGRPGALVCLCHCSAAAPVRECRGWSRDAQWCNSAHMPCRPRATAVLAVRLGLCAAAASWFRLLAQVPVVVPACSAGKAAHLERKLLGDSGSTLTALGGGWVRPESGHPQFFKASCSHALSSCGSEHGDV